MSILDRFLWGTGIATWIVLGLVGFGWIVDQTFEWFLNQFQFRKIFLQFAYEQFKKQKIKCNMEGR